MSKRDWQKDWEMCERATSGKWEVVAANSEGPYLIRMPYPQGGMWYGVRMVAWKEDAEFVAAAREALPYWLKRVRELEAEVEELRADRNIEKSMRKRQDNRCAELEEQLAVWKKVAQTLHQQLLCVPTDLEELAELIKHYLDEVPIEQFEEDLRRAGIEKCPGIEEASNNG